MSIFFRCNSFKYRPFQTKNAMAKPSAGLPKSQPWPYKAGANRPTLGTSSPNRSAFSACLVVKMLIAKGERGQDRCSKSPVIFMPEEVGSRQRLDSEAGSPLQEAQSSIPCQARCRMVIGLRAIRLEEPVSSVTVTMESHRAAGAP